MDGMKTVLCSLGINSIGFSWDSILWDERTNEELCKSVERWFQWVMIDNEMIICILQAHWCFSTFIILDYLRFNLHLPEPQKLWVDQASRSQVCCLAWSTKQPCIQFPNLNCREILDSIVVYSMHQAMSMHVWHCRQTAALQSMNCLNILQITIGVL